jgi:hypothetical protein
MTAVDLQSSKALTSVAAKGPEVIALIRELTNLSRDKVTFQGRQKPGLAELLTSYSAQELISAFKTFIEDKDLEDVYTLKYIAENFIDAADGLAHSARKRKQESDAIRLARDATKARLEAQADVERQEREKKRQEEELAWSPLDDLV